MIEENKYPPCPFCGGKLKRSKLGELEEEYICKECNKYIKLEDLE